MLWLRALSRSVRSISRGGLVGRPAGIGNDRKEHEPEECDRRTDDPRQAAEIATEMWAAFEMRHEKR